MGAYHGLLLAVHKALKPYWRIPGQLKGRPEIRIANMAVTFMLVTAAVSYSSVRHRLKLSLLLENRFYRLSFQCRFAVCGGLHDDNHGHDARLGDAPVAPFVE